jgi:predicted membrane protein
MLMRVLPFHYFYLTMGKQYDKALRIISIAVVAVVANFVFYQPDNDVQHISWLKGLAISLIEWTILLEVNRVGFQLAQQRYPLLNQTKQRIALELGWLLTATVLQRVVVTYLYDITQFWGYPLPGGTYWGWCRFFLPCPWPLSMRESTFIANGGKPTTKPSGSKKITCRASSIRSKRRSTRIFCSIACPPFPRW